MEKLEWTRSGKTSMVQSLFRILLGVALLYAGISHMTWSRMEFLAQVPNWVPMNKDLVVILSGIVEVSFGLALVVLPKWKVLVGLAAASFFILIFPGNVAQYINEIDAFGLDTDRARMIRLFFQPLLVLWALWSTGVYGAWKNKSLLNTIKK